MKNITFNIFKLAITITSIISIFSILVKIIKWKPKIEELSCNDYTDSNLTHDKANFIEIQNSLNNTLQQFDFKENNSNYFNKNIKRSCSWKKKTININRSVWLIECNNILSLDEAITLIHNIKFDLGKESGYIPFIYGVGMQIILMGKFKDNVLISSNPVDKIDNQRAIIQSLYIINNKNMRYYNSKTWAQQISGEYQKEINKTIGELVKHKK